MDNHNPPGINDAAAIIVTDSSSGTPTLSARSTPIRSENTLVVSRDQWGILERFNRKDMRILERMLRGD